MSTTTKRRKSATERDLQMLRNLLVNNQMLDTDFRCFKEDSITGSLKHLHQAWIESEYPALLDNRTRGVINDHFWMIFETASYIEKLRREPHEVKSKLLITINGLLSKNEN